MKLEIKHLVPYLPYDLKVCAMGELADSDKPKVFEMVGLDNKFVEFHEIGRTITEQYIYSDIFPILRPLSDLTKEIEVNGEKFVPIYYWDDTNRKDILYQCSTDYKYCEYLEWFIIEKLFEWHFDVFGLLENNLAIDINTLK